MKRPAAALFLAALLLLSTVPAVSASSLELSVRGPTGAVRGGEEFQVETALSGGGEFSAVQFALSFDRSRMECVDAAPGPLLAGMLSAANPKAPAGAVIAAASAEPVQGGGVLGIFRFRAKTDLENPRFTLRDVFLGGGDSGELEIVIPESLTPSGFSDIEGHWAEADVLTAAAVGLLDGYADGTFRPDGAVTRKQMALILWRAAGRPRPEAPAPFQDLGDCGGETQDAVSWGYGAGLFSGAGPETFSPNAVLTRQAAAKLLFGFAGGQAGTETLFYGVYDGTYTDSGRIAKWARPAVYWSVYHEILPRDSQDRLNPGEAVTRAQLASMLVRCLERDIL
nr:S-layer homology domain-containing protein [uncultured Oscillibacter sp.]